MAQDRQSAVDLEVFKQVAEHYRQDMRLFWVRSNFFMAVEGLLVSVFALSMRNEGPSWIQTFLVVMGLVVAVYWTAAACASTRWLKRWREQVIGVNERLQPSGQWYGSVIREVQDAKLVSSKIASLLPIALSLVWASAGIYMICCR